MATSVFARLQNRVVGEIEIDFVKREVGEFDLFGKHDMLIAVLASERGAALFEISGQLPQTPA